MRATWMIRADGGKLVPHFLEHGMAGVSWNFEQPLNVFPSLDELKAAVREANPHAGPRTAEQLWYFCARIKKGDNVLCPDPDDVRRVDG